MSVVVIYNHGNQSSLIHQYLPSQPSYVGANVGVVHLIEPVGGGAEGALVVDHGQAQVGVVQVEVEGNTPHDNQPD